LVNFFSKWAVLEDVSKFAKTNPFQRSVVLLILLSCLQLGLAKNKKIKQIKATANSAAYVAFSEKLDKEDRFRHALDRLTFGPRPGDFDRIESLGLKKWLDAQLHPEKTPESTVLLADLAPFDSLRLSIRETYLRYPPPQMIRAVARGNGQLPEDPELRAIVVRLANRYLQKKDLPANGQLDQAEDADLELKIKITDILTPDQIATLKTGKPDERHAVLETIPREKWNDFAWALTRQQRQQLMAQAPVPLRRQLMLANNPQNVVTSDLSEAKILRAVYSEHQLQELLVDFWFNHFNVFIEKGADHYSITSYERDAIRPHVFGKFYDLLLATAKSPAMLFYLDNWQSVGPQPIPQRPMANNRAKRGLNENYGRELLELHTLGVDGGYTQKDVIEVARCFTGWTIAQPRKGGEFEYNDRVHDRGQKIVLGQVIPAGGGMGDGLKVLEILSRQPATARFISLRLAQRFIADNPPPSLVNRMTETFLKTGGDLREVMETMIYSGEFWSPGSYRAKVKTPFEMVVSAVRATGADVTSALLLNNQIQRLGEPLYRKVEPNGYPIANADWVSSASLLDRMNFALALAHNRVPGVKVDLARWGTISQKDPMELARMILEQDPSDQTKSAIEKMLAAKDLQLELAQNAKAGAPQIPSLIGGLSLGSPEFQRR
jgi:uncharacterized protein (DUF1800 family)